MVDHCTWDDWVIGDCSVPCGGGARTNTKTSKPSAANGDVVCKKETISIDEARNVHPCTGTNFIVNLSSYLYLRHLYKVWQNGNDIITTLYLFS